MRWFYNMKINRKLIISFIIVALISGVVGTIGVTQITKIDKDYNQLYENYGVSLGYLTKISEGYQMRRGLLKDLIIQTDTKAEEDIVKRIREVDASINENVLTYASAIATEEDRKIYDELLTLFEQYNPLKDGFIEYALVGENDKAMGMMSGDGSKIATEVEQTIEKIIKYNVETGRNLSEEYSKNTVATIYMMVIVIAVGILFALLLGIFISRNISKPVNKLVLEANKIADGDLNTQIEVNTKDEIGMLAGAFAKMTDNLNEIMLNISQASEQVATGSKQVSDSSMALSQGATEQASSIEQLTASLEEVSSQTRLNAENAKQASTLSETVKVNAAKGNDQMQDMLASMEDINNSSSNISKIIKVIDDIAFQTNILALNAAVEAARAGQHGKGFAVVAEEVRNLAARSASAAKETTEMIENSIKKVENGTKIANQTATALHSIVDGVDKVTKIVENISVASNEQAQAIAQINQGVLQVSSVVQNNSATSQESAAASEELASQAELMKEQVSKFRLRKNMHTISRQEKLDIDPDVLSMLDKMNQKNKSTRREIGNENLYSLENTNKTNANGKTMKIKLSDNEFGKY